MIKFTATKKQKLVKSVLELDLISYSQINKILRKKDVKVNGKRVNKDVILNAFDEVILYTAENKTETYSTIYKDDNLLIVDKKSGFTSEKVFECVKEEYDSAKFIHRLDRNTSGVLVFALNEKAEEELLSGFKNRTFIKIYTAEVIGKMPKKEDTLTAYLVKDKDAASVKIYSKKVNGAVLIKTGYKVIKEEKDTSVLSVKLYTGKTHQIRAHLSYLGHPIVGDGKYGDNAFNKKVGAKSQRLKASELTFNFDEKSYLYYLNGKTFKAE